LHLQILDPEDKAIAVASRAVRVTGGSGAWSQDLWPAKEIALDDLVWHRLRYRFVYNGRQDDAASGIESISRILRVPSVRVIGQQSYVAGITGAVLVIVTDSANQAVAGPGSVRIELVAAKSESGQLLFAGPLNQRGTSDARFRLPEGATGQYTLRYLAETP